MAGPPRAAEVALHGDQRDAVRDRPYEPALRRACSMTLLGKIIGRHQQHALRDGIREIRGRRRGIVVDTLSKLLRTLLGAHFEPW